MIREIDYSIAHISRAFKENTVKTFNKVKCHAELMHHLIYRGTYHMAERDECRQYVVSQCEMIAALMQNGAFACYN